MIANHGVLAANGVRRDPLAREFLLKLIGLSRTFRVFFAVYCHSSALLTHALSPSVSAGTRLDC